MGLPYNTAIVMSLMLLNYSEEIAPLLPYKDISWRYLLHLTDSDTDIAVFVQNLIEWKF